jgi:hypothetical protein
VLNTLFPNLSALQSANMSRSTQAFNLSQAAMPNAGLSGTDVANIWMARVGAANSLTQQAGNVQAANALAQGQAFSNIAGGSGTNVNALVDAGKKIFATDSSANNNGWGTSTTTGGDWSTGASTAGDWGGGVDTAAAATSF